MSWTRPHLERLSKIELEIQQLVAEAGTDAIGIDWLIEANECLTAAQDFALGQVERKETALVFAESLRPFMQEAEQ